MSEYARMQQDLARGWNTWDTRSVLAHVLLPGALTVRLGLKEYYLGHHLRNAVPRPSGTEDEEVRLGPHAYDGSYTEAVVRWRDVEILVRSAHDGDDLVILVTPQANQRRPAALTVEVGMLWGRPGVVAPTDDGARAELPDRAVPVHTTGSHAGDPYLDTTAPHVVLELTGPAGVSTGRPRDLAEITRIVEAATERYEASLAATGDNRPLYELIRTGMAWDTVFEPSKDRVITTVSRWWNLQKRGGYALFCWDNYFAGLLAGLESKEIAYANVVEMTREITPDGFVPNVAQGTGRVTYDGSQPPVGAMVCWELYQRYGDEWLLAEVFDDLLRWNRWWMRARRSGPLICPGSTSFEPTSPSPQDIPRIHQHFGATCESGADRHPIYDDVPFDEASGLLPVHDIGQNSLYVVDCLALSRVAETLGRVEEAKELRERAQDVAAAVDGTLWDEAASIYKNRRTDTGRFTDRVSPMSFYPMLAGIASSERSRAMVDRHLLNPDEFGGTWTIASSPRSDPAFAEQDYMRGRIWPPHNFLVYLGLRHAGLPEARRSFAQRCAELVLKEWTEHGHVHENYCPDTGEGCNKPNSEPYHFWGGLLALVPLIESGAAGYFPGTPAPQPSVSAR